MGKSAADKIRIYKEELAKKNTEINKIDFQKMKIATFRNRSTEEFEDLAKYDKKKEIKKEAK